MSTTYQQVKAQIETLQRKAESLRAKEIKEVIKRIQIAVEHYGLRADDIFVTAPKRERKAPTKRATAPAPKVARKKSASKLPAKFKDGNGNAWSGRGSQPRWLVQALQSGRKIEEFAV